MNGKWKEKEKKKPGLNRQPMGFKTPPGNRPGRLDVKDGPPVGKLTRP